MRAKPPISSFVRPDAPGVTRAQKRACLFGILGAIVMILIVIATGQSGHPLSPHYADQLPLWRRGEGIPLHVTEAELAARNTGESIDPSLDPPTRPPP